MANGFSIHGDHALHASLSGAPPSLEGLLEGSWIQQAEDASEGVMRGDGIGELEKAAQPLLFGLSEFSDIGPSICTRDDGAHGDGDDIEGRCFLWRFILGSSSCPKQVRNTPSCFLFIVHLLAVSI